MECEFAHRGICIPLPFIITFKMRCVTLWQPIQWCLLVHAQVRLEKRVEERKNNNAPRCVRKYVLEYLNVRKRWKLYDEIDREVAIRIQSEISWTLSFQVTFKAWTKKILFETSNAHENLIRIKETFVNVYAYSIANCFKIFIKNVSSEVY